jgi:hypothetical protein
VRRLAVAAVSVRGAGTPQAQPRRPVGAHVGMGGCVGVEWGQGIVASGFNRCADGLKHLRPRGARRVIT